MQTSTIALAHVQGSNTNGRHASHLVPSTPCTPTTHLPPKREPACSRLVISTSPCPCPHPPTETRAGVLMVGQQHPATSLPAPTSHLPPKHEPACSRVVSAWPCQRLPHPSPPTQTRAGVLAFWSLAPGHVTRHLSSHTRVLAFGHLAAHLTPQGTYPTTLGPPWPTLPPQCTTYMGPT